MTLPTHTNRLAREKSPYLLQHAHNPVDWFPWGEEAFAKARDEGKPVFLSIGYATCHWCHVMERESFEHAEVAAFLNEHFVPVKVDREERPDVDEIYMSAVQALTGGGGWPLSAWLTPSGKPFYGGTYFPMPSQHGRPSFLDLLRRIQQVWADEREAVEHDAERLTAALGDLTPTGGDGELGAAQLRTGAEQLAQRYDTRRGGFGQQQKFPTPHHLTFLLRWHARTGEDAALSMVTTTLNAMLQGGLRDHLGGGFHRYSVDPAWRIPHFEKMLYDQAGLVRAYVEAWQVTGDPRYAEVARETVEFVLREMRAAGGAFTSAWDADSEGQEGKFYVWTPAELEAALGSTRAAAFAQRYGVTAAGNFHELPGTTHLQLAASLDDVARDHGLTVEALAAQLEADRQTLLAVRAGRVPPLHDDKVLTDWNGLMLGACALAGRVLHEARYVAAAAEAADFVLARLRTEAGDLLHRYRDGEAAIPAMLEDYAFLAAGLLDLFEATQDARWLAPARALVATLRERLWDPDALGFFQSADPGLIRRSKPTYDGAIPAGNGAAALLLIRLGRLTQDQTLVVQGAQTLQAFTGTLRRAPGQAHTHALHALDLLVGPVREVVVAGDPADAATRALWAVASEGFRPRTLVVQRPVELPTALAAAIPFLAHQAPRDGRPTAYVCQAYACQQPVHTPEALRLQLEG